MIGRRLCLINASGLAMLPRGSKSTIQNSPAARSQSRDLKAVNQLPHQRNENVQKALQQAIFFGVRSKGLRAHCVSCASRAFLFRFVSLCRNPRACSSSHTTGSLTRPSPNLFVIVHADEFCWQLREHADSLISAASNRYDPSFPQLEPQSTIGAQPAGDGDRHKTRSALER